MLCVNTTHLYGVKLVFIVDSNAGNTRAEHCLALRHLAHGTPADL